MEDDKVRKQDAFEHTILNINEISEQRERLKEEKLVNLIVEIIVSSTLKQYYEKSHPISQVQPARPK